MNKLYGLILTYSDMNSKPSGRGFKFTRKDVVLARFYDNKEDIKHLLKRADSKEITAEDFEKAQNKTKIQYTNYSTTLGKLDLNTCLISFKNKNIYLDKDSIVAYVEKSGNDMYHYILNGFLYMNGKYYVAKTSHRNILDKSDAFTMVKLDYLEIETKIEFKDFLKKKVSKENYDYILKKYGEVPKTVYVLSSEKVGENVKIKYLELGKGEYIQKEGIFKSQLDLNRAVKDIA